MTQRWTCAPSPSMAVAIRSPVLRENPLRVDWEPTNARRNTLEAGPQSEPSWVLCLGEVRERPSEPLQAEPEAPVLKSTEAAKRKFPPKPSSTSNSLRISSFGRLEAGPPVRVSEAGEN